MSEIPFNYQPITTMTLVFHMMGKVDYELLFPLIPMVDVDAEEAKFGSSLTTKHRFEPGTFINGRNEKHRRGFYDKPYDPESEAFKNSFTANIAATLKKVNVKVPSDSIQVTGAKSLDNAREAVGYVIKAAYEADKMLKRFKMNSEEIIEWLYEKSYDPSLYVEETEDGYEPYCLVDDKFDVSESPDPYVCGHLIQLLRDYADHSNFMLLLEFLANTDRSIITQSPYDIKDITISTININYSLGTNVRRTVLDAIMQQQPKYCSRFINAIEKKVSIDRVCYELPRRGAKQVQPRHSIQVHRTGMVTQSGPRPDYMKEVYDDFNKIVRDHYQLIRMDAETPAKQAEKTRKATIPKLTEPSEDLMIEGKVIVNPTDIHLDYYEYFKVSCKSAIS